MKKIIKWTIVALLAIFVLTKYNRFSEVIGILFEPRVSGEYEINPHKREKEFQCFEYALNSVSDMKNFQPDAEEGYRRGNWIKEITTKNIEGRAFATGNFERNNLMGKRVLVLFKDTHMWIDIKAGIALLIDLDAQRSLDDFSKVLIECINKKD
ncbi:MAG: hypothetical protein IE881_07815 [Epsilonproteobacteria bacterium]|nr:hypothetical protein [Campylobacterota bacterium]